MGGDNLFKKPFYSAPALLKELRVKVGVTSAVWPNSLTMFLKHVHEFILSEIVSHPYSLKASLAWVGVKHSA